MNLHKLIPDQRYLFHYVDNTVFRANFVELIVNSKLTTLIVNNYEGNRHPNERKQTLMSIDTNMISKVESLKEMLQTDCLIPDDILLVIDNYY